MRKRPGGDQPKLRAQARVVPEFGDSWATGLPRRVSSIVRRMTSTGLSGRLPRVPVIARFYGIAIRMYFREHGVPHFHAIYNERSGVFEIATLEMIEGDLPGRAERLVRDWAAQHQSELRRMWETQTFETLPGLE